MLLKRLIAAFVYLCALANPATAQEIWFAPPDDLPRPGQSVRGSEDFSKLFDANAPWQSALSKIKVLSIGATYYAEWASENDLKRIAAFLQKKGIRLNVTLQAIFAEGCGQGIEGLVTVRHQPGDVARRLRSFGLEVGSFSFDEPLYYGHIYSGLKACQFPVQEVARRLAYTVADVRKSYPNAKFIDYEPVGNDLMRFWPQTLTQWLKAYQDETNTPLDAFAMDISWNKPWATAAAMTGNILRAHSVRAGSILNAAVVPQATTEMWMAQAQRNAAALDASGAQPSFVIVANWTPHVRQMLPETDPRALTWLINWYRATHRDTP